MMSNMSSKERDQARKEKRELLESRTAVVQKQGYSIDSSTGIVEKAPGKGSGPDLAFVRVPLEFVGYKVQVIPLD